MSEKIYKRIAHEKIVSSLNVKNFRIIDLGCGSGRWTNLLAERGGVVLGVDHRPDAIKKCIDLYGEKKNLTFRVVDFRDESTLLNLGRFDLVTAFGVLHRIADPFAFFKLVSMLGDRLFVEWRTPVFLGMHNLSLAMHSENSYIDEANVGNVARSSEIVRYGAYGFWDMTPRFVQVAAGRNGYSAIKFHGLAKYDDEIVLTKNQAIKIEMARLLKCMVRGRGLNTGFFSPGRNWRASMQLVKDDIDFI